MEKIFQALRIFKRTYLLKKDSTIYSQFGEDAVLRARIRKDAGFYVDVGCWHPIKFSNTWLLYLRGWRGVNIDLGETKIRSFNLARKGDCNIVAAVSHTEQDVLVEADKDFSVGEQILPAGQAPAGGSHKQRVMRARRLTDILNETKYKGRSIDLLNIDAEGHDFYVLKGLDFEVYKPALILVETFLKSISEVLASDTNRLLTSNGYTICNWVGLTLFYEQQAQSDKTQ